MSEAKKLAEYLGFEVVYLDGFGYIQEEGEQGPEIKREANLEERTLWTDLVRLSAELAALKAAMGEPVAADAERYGERLNDASWAAVEAWNREVMGPMTGAIFNNIKGVVRAAILKYCEGYSNPAQQAKPQPDPLHDDIQSVLFEVEQVIKNGCCPWQVEAAFEAYEAARRLQQPAHDIQGS